MTTDDADREQRLCAALTAYYAAVEAGRPSSIHALIDANPDLADDLAAYFEAQDQLQRLTEPLRTAEPVSAAELSPPSTWRDARDERSAWGSDPAAAVDGQ